MDRVRKLLTDLNTRGVSFKAMSEAVGRNAAYMQQFVKRGIPVQLPEKERRRLSAFLNMPEREFKLEDDELLTAYDDMTFGPSAVGFEEDQAPEIPPASSVIKRRALLRGALPEFDLRAGASYGGGYALPDTISDGDRTYAAEAVKAEWVIPPQYLQGELRLGFGTTDVIAVDGPSMIPDLQPGDRVLVDRSHRDPRQGGIFVVREGDGVIIKHVEVIRGSEPPRILCTSSNSHYRPFDLVLDGEHVEIIGRVAGRITRM